MDEQLFEIIGYIVVFIIMVLPRLLKGLARAKVSASPPQAKTARVESVPRPLPLSIDGGELDDELLTTEAEFQEIVKTARGLFDKAKELARLCRVHGGPAREMLDAVESSCVQPVQATVQTLLGRVEAHRMLRWDEAMRIRSNLGRLGRLTVLLESMIRQRTRPDLVQIFTFLDAIAEDCLAPYLIHARRYDLAYPTRIAAVAFGEEDSELASLLHSAAIAPIAIDKKRSQRPHAWVQIASDVALDVFHSTSRLARTLSSDLGILPALDSLNQYTGERSVVSGAVGAWLPRVFADTCAALFLGPAFAAGLAGWFVTGVKQNEAVESIIGDPARVNQAPLYIRMYVACRVLGKMGLDDAGARWRQWHNKLGAPSTMTIKGARAGSLDIQVESLLGAVARVVDYLVEHPFEPLGRVPLPSIPGLLMSKQVHERVLRGVSRLVKGNPVDETGQVLLAAAQLAVERAQIHEQRILGAVLRSFGSQGADVDLGELGRTGPRSLKDVFSSAASLRQSIAIGAAFAPRSSRIGTEVSAERARIRAGATVRE